MPNMTGATRHAQPSGLETMDLYRPVDEKRGVQQEQDHHCCQEEECSQSAHQSRCHRSHLRRVLLPALAAFLTLSFLMALSCMCDVGALFGLGEDGLTRRSTGATTSSNGGPFVNHKLYLIVIFVGLLVVIILGIMLSAWCCKGVFQNPLCCPCYLCACCGGLACLECVACGLCAEGITEM